MLAVGYGVLASRRSGPGNGTTVFQCESDFAVLGNITNSRMTSLEHDSKTRGTNNNAEYAK